MISVSAVAIGGLIGAFAPEIYREISLRRKASKALGVSPFKVNMRNARIVGELDSLDRAFVFTQACGERYEELREKLPEAVRSVWENYMWGQGGLEGFVRDKRARSYLVKV